MLVLQKGKGIGGRRARKKEEGKERKKRENFKN